MFKEVAMSPSLNQTALLTLISNSIYKPVQTDYTNLMLKELAMSPSLNQTVNTTKPDASGNKLHFFAINY